MVGELKGLAVATQRVLKQLACLGSSADIPALMRVHDGSEEEMHSDFWEALKRGFVLRLGHSYRFLHDRVQEAAYALIPENERGAAHLRIGRLLLSEVVSEELEEEIFEIVNQLNRATELIASSEERERLAKLNLIAGKRAQSSSAHASALIYLKAGGALLAENSWERQYELTFALEFQRAESEFVTGDLEAAEERLSMLARRAGSIVDHAAVTMLRAVLYTTLDRSDRGVAVCLEYLSRVGVQWELDPTNDEVQQEFERIWRQLGNRSIEELVELPPMSDPACRATINVLESCAAPALFTDQKLKPQPGAWQRPRIEFRLHLARNDPWSAVRQLRGWVPLWQGRVGSIGKMRAGSHQGPRLHGFRKPSQSLDQSRAHQPRHTAARL
jgi:predicted ATPase